MAFFTVTVKFYSRNKKKISIKKLNSFISLRQKKKIGWRKKQSKVF